MSQHLKKKIPSIHPWMELRHHALIAFFCVLSLGQLQRIETTLLPAFYVHELLMCVYLLVHLGQPNWRAFCWNKVRRLSTLSKVWLSWVGAGLVVAFFTQTLTIMPLLYFGRAAFYILNLATLIFDLKNNVFTRQQLWTALVWFVALLIYFGVLQYAFLPDLRFLFFLGWDDHYYRLASTLLDPGFTGLILVLGYSVLRSALTLPDWRDVRWRRYTLRLLSISAVATVALTYSRASYLALGVVLAGNTFVLWKQQRWRACGSLVLLLVFVVSLRFLPQPGGEGVNLGRTSTIVARATSTGSELAQLDTLPELVLGQGLFVQDTISTSLYSETPSHAKQPDSWLILLLTGTGVVGTLLALFLLAQYSKSAWRREPRLVIGLAAILVHGMFNASITYPFVILIFGAWYIATQAAQSEKAAPGTTLGS